MNNSSAVSTHHSTPARRREGDREDTGSDRANPRKRAGGREGSEGEKETKREEGEIEEDGDRAIERAKTSPSPSPPLPRGGEQRQTDRGRTEAARQTGTKV